MTQTPDYWGNDYFDDTYWHNGVPTPYRGYCTDVFFDQALRFIEERQAGPFFVYLATNAPHGPFLVDEKYSRPYAEKNVPEPMDRFYGMIENIDENMGRLTAKLDELGIAENTLLIFMTDNGSAAGVANTHPTQRVGVENPALLARAAKEVEDGVWQGFNAGMRGRKGSEYDGGHRVPFFARWPNGKLGEPRDVGRPGRPYRRAADVDRRRRRRPPPRARLGRQEPAPAAARQGLARADYHGPLPARSVP